jgi:hypothetical protein
MENYQRFKILHSNNLTIKNMMSRSKRWHDLCRVSLTHSQSDLVIDEAKAITLKQGLIRWSNMISLAVSCFCLYLVWVSINNYVDSQAASTINSQSDKFIKDFYLGLSAKEIEEGKDTKTLKAILKRMETIK